MDHTARVQRIQYFTARVSHQSEMTFFVDNVGPDCRKSHVLRWLDSHGFQDTYGDEAFTLLQLFLNTLLGVTGSAASAAEANLVGTTRHHASSSDDL